MNLETFKQLAREQLSPCFQGLPYYDELVFSKMLHIISSITTFEDLCQENVRMVLERCFTMHALAQAQSLMTTEIFSEIKHALLAVYVLIQYHKDESDPSSNFFRSTAVLVSRYPVFAGLEAEDLLLLLRFRNVMVYALKFISAEQNKKALLDICAKLEGRSDPIKYHTGTGMTLHTTRRVLIYSTEANLDLGLQHTLIEQLLRAPTRRVNSRKAKNMVVPALSDESIAIFSAFPEAVESRLLPLMNPPNPASLSIEESKAFMTLISLFRDVRELDKFVGGAVLKELSAQIQNLRAKNAFSQDLSAARHVDEEQILTRNFAAFDSHDKEMVRLWNRLKAAGSVLKLLLLQDLPVANIIVYQSTSEFVASYADLLSYPDLEGDGQSLLEQEQGYLFRFANAMRLLHAVTPHRLEQSHLLAIGERMEDLIITTLPAVVVAKRLSEGS